MNQRLPFAGAGWRVALLGVGMSTKTLTRADLTEAVFNAVGLSRNESSQMVEDILEEVCGALSRGETVKLSSFGTFQVRQKSQRVGRNPKTGDEVPIAPRRVLVFRPSHVLKAQINGLDSTGVDEED
jgi:integration host factor subunit alpha